MGISLDLYDFFAHLIPGSVFVLAFLYGFQEAWLRSPEFAELGLVLLVGLGLLSYIVGYVTDPLANRWYRLFRSRSDRFSMSKSAIQSLCQKYPWMQMTPPAEHWYLLLAYIKHHNLPMAQEIERFNVTHIMLRGISLGLLVFSIVFCTKVITNPGVLPYLALSLLSIAASYLLIKEAIKFRGWFYKSIYQSVLALKLTPDQLPVAYRFEPSKVE